MSPSRSPLFIPEGLPPLTPPEIARVEEMVEVLRAQIANAGGSISFADYMETALYAPGRGYYTGGLHKFGAGGDFVTAPEISPLFGHCVARPVAEMLAQIETGAILEIGAGSGALAVDLLESLETLGITPRRYLILELSHELRTRQAATLAARLPHWLPYVEWCSDWPAAGWKGVVVANEFLDALPVHRFELTKAGVMEQRVIWDENGFAWRLMPATGFLAAALEDWQIQYGAGLANGYVSELASAAPAWLATLAERLEQGGILLVDYGYSGPEYYHPERCHGTLMCHYRHRCHDDPLILPGRQDITAHVNFTALATAAVAADLTVAGYTTQANFLIATGIADAFAQFTARPARAQLSLANQVRRLTLPQEMGELFKVMALTRALAPQLIGFQARDFRNRLNALRIC